MHYFKQLKQNQEDEKDPEEGKKINDEDDDEDEKKDGNEEQKEEQKKAPEEKRGRNVPPLITTIKRKRPQMTRERWMEMAQIRRWDVKITGISIENLYKEPFDPFIEFVVGGDFKIVQKQIKKGKSENTYTGTLGYTKKTEVVKNLEPKDMKMMDTRMRCEYQGSYFDIQEQFLRVDVWDWEKWNLNEFMGRIELPLIEIIQGDVEQTHIVYKSGEKKKIKLCRLNFTIAFQEIWDFILNFSDWGGTGLISEKGDGKVCPSLGLSLVSQGIFRTVVRTAMIENESNPQWPNLKGEIRFRGTINDLHNQRLGISLYEGSLLSSRQVGIKVTDLLGIVDSGFIATDIVQKYKKRGGHSCSIKGRINIRKVPKHRQTGEIILLNSELQYLCVTLLRVDNIVLPHDKGAVNTFFDVEWGGYVKKSRTAFHTYKPIFNDTFYFPINVPVGILGTSDEERTKAILAELELYNHLDFNFWSIDEQMSNDALGSATFFITELQSAKIQEKEFFDEKTQSNQVMKIRVWSGKKQLKSPFISAGEISNVFIEVWLLYENEKKIEYEDLPKEIANEFPEGYEKFREQWDENAKFMRESFPEETQRNFLYEMHDESDERRFVPTFLSKIGYPNPSRLQLANAQEISVDYFAVETLKQRAYFVSLIPFTNAQNDIWSSPEFLIQMKKGESEDHSIFLACLLTSSKINQEESITEEIETLETSPSHKIKEKQKKKKQKFTLEEKDMEDRVFMCIGSLKQRKTQHAWVMTINEDCSGIKFWETTNNMHFELERRVSSPENLEKFLNKEIVTHRVFQSSEEVIVTKNHVVSDEDILDDDFADSMSFNSEEEEEEEELKIKPNKEGDMRIRKTDTDIENLRFKHKTTGMNKLTQKVGNFLDIKRDEEKKDRNNFTSIIQEPRLLPGAEEATLPYRTIDIIFNKKNVYMNLQHYDPGRIIYDIYDDNLWYPFCKESFKLYGAFYSPPVLLPPLNLLGAKKLHSNVIKELIIGISALRSGKNLPTSWKNSKDICVEQMEEHLKFLEQAARGEYDERKINEHKREWSLKIRQFMPVYYRFSAVPGHFNYPEADRISSVFIENSKEFLIKDYKNMKWAVAARIFPYVGKIISIRVMVAAFHPVPGAEMQ